MSKELLFSLSKDKGDFVVQPFKGSGNGGQKKNKTMSACRIIHPASGAVAECQEERSFFQNRKIAFERCINRPEFQKWYKIECARQMGHFADIDQKVKTAMKDENLKVEMLVDGKWVPYEESQDGNG